MSPRSNIVPNPVFGIIPYRRQRIGLGIHEIAPLLAVAMLAKVTNKIVDEIYRSIENRDLASKFPIVTIRETARSHN
jgi:hypothetical protein